MRIALAALRDNPASAAFYPRHDPRSTFAEMAVWWMCRDAVPTSLDTFYGVLRMQRSTPQPSTLTMSNISLRASQYSAPGGTSTIKCFDFHFFESLISM
jgi:hypothetical protein